MALGFGFNKVKVLSAAEKFVQQGKLQNAIAEYEKVIKEDPKDLTVLNTIGDLYARVGQNEKACEYFKKVGDQYAVNGFTIKAIAIYKKLTRLAPPTNDSIIKLAELYTQQGLFNDARTQYMQIADHLLKSGDHASAARIFQKILELEPENIATQSKLADLYIKLGKKEDARNIYFNAAKSLHALGSFDSADEALNHVLSLDPNHAGALLLRGMVASATGDSLAAIQYLEKVPDLDSRADALLALLKARLQTGNMEGVEGTANKLFTVHNDMTGVSALAEWFLANQRLQEAFQLYDRHADRFLSQSPNVLLETLYPIITRIRSDAAMLLLMLRLLQKAGDTSHINEVMELLAHAHVQEGELAKARDLYKALADAEPENPLHGQNYKQMLAKLGQDSMARPLSAEEAAQAFMVEELEHGSPLVQQNYSPTAEKAIEAAITDAELFVSYNVPLKAIAPLEAALPFAPRDVNLNQRLATLYAKADRYADAARACQILSEIYGQFGHKSQAASYGEAARKYGERAGQAEAALPQPDLPRAVEPERAPLIEAAGASQVREFDLDMAREDIAREEMAREEMASEAAETEPAKLSPLPEAIPEEATVSGFGFEITPEAPADAASFAVDETSPSSEPEIGSANEWEDMLSVEKPPAPEPVAALEPAAALADPGPSAPDLSLVADKIQEIRFYILQGFWEIAKSAVRDLVEIAPDSPELEGLAAEISQGQLKAAREARPAPVETPPIAAAPVPPAPPPVAPSAPAASPAPVLREFFQNLPAAAPLPVAMPVPPVAAAPPALAVEAPIPVEAPPASIPVPSAASRPVPIPVPAPAPSALSSGRQEERQEPAFDEFILDVPIETPPPAPARAAGPTPSPVAAMAPPAPGLKAPVEIEKRFSPSVPADATPPAAASTPVREPAFAAPVSSPRPVPVKWEAEADELILDVPDDLPLASQPKRELPASEKPALAARPAEQPALQAAAPPAPPARAESTEDILGHLVMDLEDALGDFLPVTEALPPQRPEPALLKPSSPIPPPLAPAPEVSAPPGEILDLEFLLPEEPEPQPPTPPSFAMPAQMPARTMKLEEGIPAGAAHRNGDTGIQDPEAASILSDILQELREETDEVTSEAADPETHYNLGIAFKEMGLLDEAIGELQKVCHAVERGNGFAQPIQAFTWLAQCLVDKGVPEAAVRWYESALKLPGLDVSSRCSIYYDLGSAYEAYGDRKSALVNFMEVYGANIDYRDVANRIKVLKS